MINVLDNLSIHPSAHLPIYLPFLLIEYFTVKIVPLIHSKNLFTPNLLFGNEKKIAKKIVDLCLFPLPPPHFSFNISISIFSMHTRCYPFPIFQYLTRRCARAYADVFFVLQGTNFCQLYCRKSMTRRKRGSNRVSIYEY